MVRGSREEVRRRQERDVLGRYERLARGTGDPRWGTGGMPSEARAGRRPRRPARAPARPVVRPTAGGGFAGLAPRGYRRSDVRVRDEVCDRFTENAYLDPREIDVEVHGGQVTLSGAVASRTQRGLAEDLARAVPGVEEVRNRLVVRRPSHSPAPGAAKRWTG
jgi:hypothetical protein